MMMNDDDNYIGDDGDGGGGGDDGDGGTIVEHDEDAAKVAEVVESDGLLALESICNDNDNDDDNDNDNDEDGDELPPTPLLSITTTTVVSLPLLLQFLYGLNGLTLSLLTLPVMYIVNTRVEVPLPYLPSYGAIAFLPYSLKPIYAYLCTINNVGDDIIPKVLVLLEQRVLLPPLHWLPLWMKRRWRRQHQNRRRRRPQQQYTHNNNHNTGSNSNSNSNRYLKLFSGLLTVNSILTVSFVCIPPKGEGGTGTGTTRSILLVFLVAFGRGFFDSWAEFCLGLTLIDFARKMDSEKQRTLNSNRNSDRSYRVNQAQQNESQQQQQQTSYYNVIISQLQAQAATSTNLGAWLANFVTCLVFLERYRMIDEEENNNHDENKQQLSGGVANALILTTAIIQLLGAIVVYLYHHHRNGNNQSNNNCTTTTTRLCSSSLVSNNSNNNNNNSNIYEELPTSATAMTSLLQQNNESINDNDTDNNDEENNGRTIISTELYTLYDEENNDTNNNNSHPSNSSLENLAADETERLSTTDSNHSNNNNNNINSRSSVGIISNWVMVILLQLILLIIALKGPVIEWTSHYIWEVWVIILAFAILVTAVALYYNNSWKRSHRVGLFLIVRNAIPSDTMIVSSFFYYLFQSQPLVLQLLSFLGAGVSSFSSWSYTRLWSRYYSRGRPLLMLMGGTVVLASFASLLNIVVFRQYHHQLQELLDGGGSGGGGSESATTTMLNTNIFVIAIISKFVITFFSEWAFLPEIVLASTSVEIPTTITTTTMTTSPDNDNDNDNDIIENREDIRNSSHHEATTDLVVASATITRPVLVLSTDDQENEHPTTINNTSSGSNSNNNNNSSEIDDDGKAIAIEYGTLLSCIDFGDQLGSLTAAPLVAFLNISRENGFLHMDRLIFICALTNIIVSLGLLPLLVEKKMK